MAKNEALRVAELRSRLEVVVPRLLSNAAAGSAATAAAPSASASAGPPSARLVDIETATTKPTEAEVLTRSLVPLLQLTADDGGSGDHAHEATVVDLCFDELTNVLAHRAPELCALVHAMHVGVQAALRLGSGIGAEALLARLILLRQAA